MNGMGILEFDLEVEVLSRDNRVGLGRNNLLEVSLKSLQMALWLDLGGEMEWNGMKLGVELGGVSVIV